MTRWNRIADWFQQNLSNAQQGMDVKVKLNFEWYDENSEDLKSLGQTLAQSTDVFAFIGPQSTKHVRTVAYKCARTYKTLLAPSATSAELARTFSSRTFLWDLSETDISQCEIMLTTAFDRNCKTVALLSADSEYGQTFTDWFAFQAVELGLDPIDVQTYDSSNRDARTREMMQCGADALLCVPNATDDVEAILDIEAELGGSSPQLIFSDLALDADVLELPSSKTDDLLGVSPYADPESGFKIAYEELYGETPTNDEIMLYNAMLLTAFATADCAYTG